ncbi:hypothetical protein SeMB42_g04198 [Synchytrium endobioticum]|uniref:Uncharacterized protein n=1 Tax=Synchytrium endobioticum TaxID=286115 RepID=A0A507D019_9FUNG|nr:hypothetical protein SeMB42_g04198 [Synchytrium endobioticum]
MLTFHIQKELVKSGTTFGQGERSSLITASCMNGPLSSALVRSSAAPTQSRIKPDSQSFKSDDILFLGIKAGLNTTLLKYIL